MTLLDEGIALRDKYLIEHGLTFQDFGLNYAFPAVPPTGWEWYKQFKFGVSQIYRRFGLFLIYLNPQGEPYLHDDVPYGVVRFLGTPTGVPEGESAPKILSQWGRRSELHFEPLRDGRAWESLVEGTRVLHCESLVKAKAVHKATGIPCVGYNGVNGYSSNKQGVELIHKYSGFDFSKMHNIILYDSDVLTNPRVTLARENLSHKLRHIMLCSQVSWATLPQREHQDGPPSNWGPDDFLLEFGAAALLKLIDGAVAYQDEEFSDLVEEVNEKFRWVRNQNTVYDRRRRALTKWQDAVLSLRNVNRVVASGKTKRTVFGTDVWIQSKNREEVDSVGYRYLEDEFFSRDDERVANEYIRDGAEPGPEGFHNGDIIQEMLQRLFAPADLELLRSYLKFLKFSGDKPTSYCILWSTTRGVGKGWFTDFARALLGRRHVAPATADSLAEKFNLHTINTRLVIAHEFQASSSANKKLALNYLKTFVGDESIMVRAMNRNPYKADVRAGLIITVNDKSEMPSDGLGDRRQWYIEAGAGLRAMGEELWPPEHVAWTNVWDALKDTDAMARAANWIAAGQDLDFKSWRPPMTDERAEDLILGQSGPVQIAHEVLKNCRELGIRVMDGKAIRALMVEKLEGQDLYLVGSGFAKCLKEAGWWTDAKYARVTQSKSAAWFTGPVQIDSLDTITASQWMKEDAIKAGRKY